MPVNLADLSSVGSGSGVYVMRFQTADAAHGWLNGVLAIGEGSIDPDRGLLAMRHYARTPTTCRASRRRRSVIGSPSRGTMRPCSGADSYS